MIIQRRGNELLLVRQRDHAALAARIMTGWHPGGLVHHPRREAILAAARDHDEGWREEDAEMHVSESGDPLDFISVPARVKHRIWPRAVERLSGASPHVAALVAQHALTIHAPLSTDREWAPFIRLMAQRRDAMLSRCAPDAAAALAQDYPFVRTGDQLSLIFCNGWTAPLSGVGYRAVLRGTTLEITPDPFERQQVRLSVEARAIPARAYGSASELRHAYEIAAPLVLEGLAIGA